MATLHDRVTGVGALLVGDMIATAVWGISSFQTYTYFYYPRLDTDSNGMRLLVMVLWFLDTLHVICTSHSIYHYLIVGFNDVNALSPITWSLALSIGITTLITWIVHCFFARRIYILSRGQKLIPNIIVALATIRLGFGIGSTTECFKLATFTRYAHLVRWLFTSGLSIAVVSDGIITVSCCYYLSKSRSGFKKMDAIVSSLQRYLIQSGAMTTIVTAVSCLSAAIMPFNLVWIGAHFVISKLYTASLVAALNARDNHGHGSPRDPENPFELSGLKIQVATTREVVHGDSSDANSTGDLAKSPVPRSPRVNRSEAFYFGPFSQDSKYTPNYTPKVSTLSSSSTKVDDMAE